MGNNGIGGAGVSWGSRLMPLKVSRPDGTIVAGDLADAFMYARDSGVQVVNASLGGPDGPTVLRQAIDASPNVLFVVSAGNDEEDVDDPLNLTRSRSSSPASTRHPTSSASPRPTTATSSRPASPTSGPSRWTSRRPDRAS